MIKRKCRICDKKLANRKKKYCSIVCRNTGAGRASGDKRRKSHNLVCKMCDKHYSVVPSRLKISKYCSMSCRAYATVAIRKNNVI